jgi:hypothetical protein
MLDGPVMVNPYAEDGCTSDVLFEDIVPIGRYTWEFSRPLEQGAPMNWARARSVLGADLGKRTWEPGFTLSTIDPLLAKLAAEGVGNRNSLLYWCARRACESDLQPWDLRDTALRAGLTESETDKTIQSAIDGHVRDKGPT